MAAYFTKGKQGARLPNGSRTSSGVTLVEILVVSVIVAILSAVAIPMYSGFIKNQRRLTAKAFAQTAAITAGSIQRRLNHVPDNLELNAAISNPNPNQFSVGVSGGPPYYVIVIEGTIPDTVQAAAKF